MTTASPQGPMISSDDVEGTDVYSTDSRDKIGDIHHLMIDKRSGQIGYAVMSFGGFLGIGEKHYPVPWYALKYDTDLGGYVTGITASQLENAPEDSPESWRDRDWETRVHDNYDAPYYWEFMPRILGPPSRRRSPRRTHPDRIADGPAGAGTGCGRRARPRPSRRSGRAPHRGSSSGGRAG